ncbi:MAG: hypothetical protein KJ072_01325 [Verrucomicrobia bacterium]|nr:hypothetical protein [Verrucomicrobiota bacterium]
MNERKRKKRAPLLPFPMNSLGNPHIRSLKPYSFSADSRAEKPGVAKSLAVRIWSRLAKVEPLSSGNYAIIGQEEPA